MHRVLKGLSVYLRKRKYVVEKEKRWEYWIKERNGNGRMLQGPFRGETGMVGAGGR